MLSQLINYRVMLSQEIRKNVLFLDFYNVTNSRGRVCRFCLFKQAYRIGDDIVGTCDFSQATIPCVQVNHLHTG